jgi:L-iditol 2-dehydrogenase/threonine 3-dehydrogenase
MRQAIMPHPGQIDFREAETPKVGTNEILLSIKKIGVCGSDIHVWHGQHPFTPYPVIQGHEFSGEVVAIGEGVTKVKVGMKATAAPQEVCEQCPPCLRGDYNICDNLKVRGFQAPGCAQDFFAVPEARVVAIPDSLSYEQGAFIEPSAVAAHATMRAPNLKGKNVVVFGAGTIGNLLAQAAYCRGAKKVLISDINDFRLKKAQEVGILDICNVATEDFKSAAQAAFGDEGFDVAFEAAGVEASLDTAVQQIQKGGCIVVVAVYGERPRVDISILGDRELSLVGTLMYRQEDYEQAVAWLASGQLNTESLVTARFPFEQYNEAYQHIDKNGGSTLKVMIDL